MRVHVAIAALLLLVCVRCEARDVFQFGGASGVLWQDHGTLTFIDVDQVPGAIRPFATEPSHNLISSMQQRGGGLSSIANAYTLPADWDANKKYVVDGDSTTAFVHPPRIVILGGGGGFWTTQMFFDLGAPFLVDRIRFITRPDHPENQMRGYVLYFNDGTDESRDRVGNIVWTKYRTEVDNLERVVDLDIEPRMVRHIYLRPGTEASNGGLADTWEVAEFEVYGQGFVPAASFVSDPIYLGEPASLGQIQWGWQLDENAQILVQTRTGSDDQPYVYWRKTGVGDEISSLTEQGRPLTAADYAVLTDAKGGITDDLTNWSPWQTYELEMGARGTQVLSPSPRSYIQVRVQFSSVGLAGGQVDSLRFEYSLPPVASVVGEIHPTQVEAARSTLFTYSVRSRLEGTHSGFNALRLRTAARIDSILQVRIDRQVIDEATFSRQADDSWLIGFPRIDQDQTLLEVDFQASVYRYGTPFNAAVVDADNDEVPLEVVAGDAVAEFPDDRLMVRIGLQGDLITDLSVAPNPFTPNGDGRNDRATVAFSLLRLTETTPVTLRIYDLAGRLVRQLTTQVEGSQTVTVEWDGEDGSGHLTPPGLYVFRLSVDADGGGQETVGQIAVAY